ncbi:MAG: SGNH/GDSL hydrolase family protein [Alphaproteobacteria bacterium]|nr:SGNH/GDSL hydrolase family protein [Alphaproteobacteria bacterium]
MGTSLTANQLWPKAVASRLRLCTGREASVEIVAGSGETSAWGRQQTDRVANLHPDVVLVEFAVNDGTLQRFMTVRASVENMTAIVTSLRARNPAVRIIFMRMNPASGIRGWIRIRRGAYEAAHRELASRVNVEYVDFSDRWSSLTPIDLKRVIADGIHPDPAAAARLMAPTLANLIGGARCAP